MGELYRVRFRTHVTQVNVATASLDEVRKLLNDPGYDYSDDTVRRIIAGREYHGLVVPGRLQNLAYRSLGHEAPTYRVDDIERI